MALPKLIKEIVLKDKWIPKIRKAPNCYLYDFKALGITPRQFGELFWNQKAYLFETSFSERLAGTKCPWCEFNARPKRLKKLQMMNWRGQKMQDHIYSHVKNIVSYQSLRFQEKLYTLRLQLIRQGYHGAISFLVEHTCQACINPNIEGRRGMCAIPLSPRNRIRSLKVLGYPIKSIKKHREHEWSCLGVIVLLKN